MAECRFARAHSQCNLCALKGSNIVRADLPAEGVEHAGIVVLSEAPGEAEDRIGHVLIGPSGSFFNWALGQADLRRDRLWLTNVISCRPPKNDIHSAAGLDAIASCALGLHEELKAAWDAGYRTILAQGQTAIEALGISGKIGVVRGSVIEGATPAAAGFPPFRVVATLHPSAVLQSKWDLRLTYVSDLRKLREVTSPSWKPTAERFILEPGLGEAIQWLDARAIQRDLIGADIETDGLDRYYGEIVCLSFATSEADVLSLPWRVRGRDDFYFSEPERLLLRPHLENFFARCRFVFQNAAFDVPYIREKLCALPVDSILHDTFLLHSVVSPETEHNLGFITSVYGTTPYWKDSFKNRPGSIYVMDRTELYKYNCRDSAVLLQVLPSLLVDLERYHLEHQYYDETMPLFRRAVVEMEEAGVGFDYGHMDSFKAHMETIVSDLEDRLRQLGGLPAAFSFTAAQLQWFLFDKRPLAIGKALGELRKHEEALGILEANIEDFKRQLAECPGTKKGLIKKLAAREASLARKGQAKNLLAEREARELAEGIRPLFVVPGYDGIMTTTGDFSTGKDGILSLKGRLEREAFERDSRLEKHDKALAEGGLSALQTGQREAWRTKAEGELERISALIDFLDGLIDRSGLQKLLDAFTKYKPAPDDRIHPWWNAGGAATGRFSCSGPNLMQLPKGDDDEGAARAKHEGLEVRRFFICRPGYGFATADLENAEVAMFGYETGDDLIIDTYLSGANIHDVNTRTLFALEKGDALWKAARGGAKIFQFGRYQYGGTLRTVMRQIRLKAPGLHVTMQDLEAADARWWAAHPAVKAWGERVEEEVLANRIIYNAFGRARLFMGDTLSIGREAKSFLIQGGIGSVVNQITLRIATRKAIEAPDAALVMQYHDQLVYEAPIGQLDIMCRILKEEFERPFLYRGIERHIRSEVEYSLSNFGDLSAWNPDITIASTIAQDA